jgi:HNH endonuclease
MPDKKPAVPKELRDRIAKVTNKRARFVLDAIVKKGRVTTEEINRAGYDHPPRAAQDVRDLGFRLKTIKVKHSNGRTIAGYVFDEGELEAGKEGRRLLPKKQRDTLIHAAGDKCQICGAEHNLQVDHRIPYEVAGESQSVEERPYQILCGSCNRKKSWACEHCQNWLQDKSLDVCRSCYWAEPSAYSHVAMQQQRRADLVWIGDEVMDFERIRGEAVRHQRTVPEEIIQILKCTK